MFSTRMTGSYERTEWKQCLHDRLRDARLPPVADGAVSMDLGSSVGLLATKEP
jgi:hypothetical protein